MKKQSGVFVPAIAVLMLTLIGFIVFLGIRPAEVKLTSLKLKQELVDICSSLAIEPWMQAEAVAAFQSDIQTWNIGNYAEVTHAALVIPTMQDDFGDHPQPSYSMDCGPDIPSCMFYGNPQDYPNTDKLPLGNNPFGDNFWQSHLDPNSTSRLINQGNTIVCEAEATFIDSGLFGFFRTGVSPEKQIQESKITARVAYWRPPRNWNMDPPLNESTAQKFATRGLTIVVAPHMSTFTESSRFIFDNPAHSNFDPHRPDVVSSKFLLTPSDYFAFQVASDPTAEKLPALSQMQPALTTTWQGIPATDPAPKTDKHQLLASCMNPPVLARNIFLSTIAGLASRTAHLRWNTDIYVAGTQHQVRYGPNSGTADDDDADNGLPYFYNPPIQVVARGTDITRRQYQLPYISYYNGLINGNSSTRPDSKINSVPEAEPNRDDNDYEYARLGNREGISEGRRGWVLPFYSNTQTNKYTGTGISTTVDENIASLKAYISAQLRYCYHLYEGSINGGLDIDPAAALASQNPHADNSPPWAIGSFEPDSLEPRGVTSPNNGFGGTMSQWDQIFDSGATGPWGSPANPLDGINAEELLSIIGTIQSCPFEMGQDNAATLHFPNTSQGGNPPFCSKPPGFSPTNLDIAPHDLRPDLIGVFSALGNGVSPEYRLPNNTAISSSLPLLGAVKSPGIFGFRSGYTLDYLASTDTSPSIMQPFDTVHYDYTINNSSNIYMIVTHQPITAEEERVLAPIIRNNFRNVSPIRPVIIVYLPVSNSDASNDVKRRFLNILGLTDDDPVNQDWGAGINQYVEISPFSSRYIVQGTTPLEFKFGTGNTVNTPEEVLYKSFWNNIITPPSSPLHDFEDAAELGSSVFKNNIITTEPLL